MSGRWLESNGMESELQNMTTSMIWFLGATLASILIAIAWVGMDRVRRTAPYQAWPKFLIWTVMRFYCKLYHRPTFVGEREAFAEIGLDEPLILVANHTGAVDPLVVGTQVRRGISWMMERSFNVGPAKLVTYAGGTIFVDRDGRDLEGLRQALRVLQGNGALGIFPEGGIARPPEVIRPFETGVGFMIRKTKAVVLPIWISGTPKVDHAMQCLLIPSRTRVVFGKPVRFDDERDVQVIADRLRAIIREMSGWPYIEDTEAGEVSAVGVVSE